MKMILKFDDEDYSEKDKFMRAVTADSTYNCLWEVSDYFRQLLKDREGVLTDVQYEFAEKIAEKINEIYSDNKIDLDLWS